MGTNLYRRVTDKLVEYGTAGFRGKAEGLDYVVYRMGMLAVLRSQKKNSQTIGLMVTASHNPEGDNGVKLVDPYGEMLDQSWEVHASNIVNAKDDELLTVIDDLIKTENINANAEGFVFIGRDTRISSPLLADIAQSGVTFRNGTFHDYGIVTTPMLHYYVTCKNTNNEYGEADELGYFKKLSTAFKNLVSECKKKGNYEPQLIFDGANGVGGIKMDICKSYLESLLQVEIFNNGTGVLNLNCGADFVKVNQKAPLGIPIKKNERCVSVDGDADRVIYYYLDSTNSFHLLDGDRIATLIASYLKELVEKSGLTINLGLVQTAYANGSSTRYISEHLSVPVACVSTGVKYLHHKALEFDIGVYFEANGHGTVVYKKEVEKVVKEAVQNTNLSGDVRNASNKLLQFINLTNQTVGDALSDILLVEAVLYDRGWSVVDWDNTYSDLPNRLMKVSVKDRNVIETTDAERKCTKPEGLQSKIDELVLKYNRGRSFVRPSGTEDVVRIYAEAATQAEADQLATDVSIAVYNLANGVGKMPEVPK